MKNEILQKLAKGGKQKNQSTNNAVIYTRVSSKEQADNNMSLETQKKACIKYAEKEGLIVKESFGGTYESAKTDDRPEFNHLIEYVKDRKNCISYLLVYSLDRFSRTGTSGASILANLSELGIEVISVTQPIDSTSTSGRFQQNIVMLFSQFDNDLRKEKTIAGMKAKLELGYWITALPAGYEKDKNTGSIHINSEGQLIKEGFELFVQGFSISQLVSHIGDRGLRLSKQRWSHILQNPFYCGLISHKMLDGKIVEGKHKPLVSQELFQRVYEIRNDGGRLNVIKPVNRKHPLKGFVKCNRCGTPLTGYEQKGYEYYKCNRIGCGHNISGIKLSKSFKDFIAKFELKSKYEEVIKSYLVAEFDQRNEHITDRLDSVRKTINESQRKLEQLNEKFLYSSSIPEELYNSEKSRLQMELNNSQDYMQKLTFELSNSTEFIDYSLDISGRMADLWDNGDYETQLKLQNLVFPEGITFDKDSNSYRTTKINQLFDLILALNAEIKEKRKGRLVVNTKSSPLVAGTRLELVTFGL